MRTLCIAAGIIALSSSCSAGSTAEVDVIAESSSVSDSPAAPPSTGEVPASEVPSSEVPSSEVPTSEVPSTTAAPSALPPAPPSTYEVVTHEGMVVDPVRAREVPYLVYAPVGRSGPVPLILVSHGGAGNERGHLSAPHLGSTFAAGGFVAIHLAHVPSTGTARHLIDRPADVTFLLDQLEAGAIVLPAEFSGAIDLDRVGHTGHSFGAYTSHAVGGATYTSTYRDERIDAIAPISPQGPDQFGAFDRGPDDNTWVTVTIPVYNLIGGSEIDSNAVDSVVRPGWRLVPFDRYPATSDTFRTIIDGQIHADMWREGSPEVKQFIATEILEFMQVYVADETTEPCGVGIGDLSLTHTERRAAASGSLVGDCA